MNKTRTAEEAVSHIENGSTLLVGGFYGVGTPHVLVDEIVRQGKRDLTIVTVEAGSPGYGLGKLLENGCASRLIATWIGNLKGTVNALMEAGKLELEINPQGTLVERIRSGGYGLGGVLTPTGLDTYIEETGIGTRMTVDGRDWLYHTPIWAETCIVEAYRGDVLGNLAFRASQMNFNNTMCTAAGLVIATVMEPIGPRGSMEPLEIHVPGVFVDMVVPGTGAQAEVGR